jgi:hypothetical protein
MIRDVDESLPVGKWVYGLLLAFLIAVAAVTCEVAVDWQHRHELETISHPTAVGDPVVVVFDPKQEQAKEIVRWKGTPYYAVENGVTSLPEYSAFKLATDDSGRIWLYQERHQTTENRILAKIGANQFLRLAPK